MCDKAEIYAKEKNDHHFLKAIEDACDGKYSLIETALDNENFKYL